MITLHDITDYKKLAEIEKSLEANGWIGSPLVLINDNGELLTGSHRYTAAENLGWHESEIPTILLKEIFEEDGKDLDEISQDWGYPSSSEGSFYRMIDVELSEQIKEKYGIDCD